MQAESPEMAARANDGEKESEELGLLEKMAAKVIKDPRKLSVFYGVCNMSDFLIGAGILGLASVLSTGGWLIGCILLAIFGVATWFSLDLLLDAAIQSKSFSYESIACSVGGWPLQMVIDRFLVAFASSAFRTRWLYAFDASADV
jgi:hypothetical protein